MKKLTHSIQQLISFDMENDCYIIETLFNGANIKDNYAVFCPTEEDLLKCIKSCYDLLKKDTLKKAKDVLNKT